VVVFSEAGRYLGREDYVEVAIRNIEFILSNMYQDRHLFRSWRDGKVQYSGYLEDYAGLALAQISLYQSDHNPKWFEYAEILINEILTHFQDPRFGFFDTSDDHENLITRPKRLQDNAIPSGNSLAATALLQLAAYTGNGNLRDYAERMMGSIFGDVIEYPLAYAKWLCAIDFALNPVFEVGILGVEPAQPNDLVNTLWESFRPNLVAAISEYPPPPNAPALLKDRPLLSDKPTAFVCRNHICKYPVSDSEALTAQLSNPS
jgi:uncharacterized protein YyaL (SSP411 family)